MKPSENSIFALKNTTAVFFRHRWKAILFFGTLMCMVMALALFMPRGYHSEAKLEVRLGRENAALPVTATTNQSTVVAVPPSRQEEINSMVEILKDQSLIAKVVDEIGPAVILGQQNAAVARPETADEKSVQRYEAIDHVLENLKVEPVPKSSIIQLSYEAFDPKLAQLVLSKLIEYHLQQHAQASLLPGNHEFFQKQLRRSEIKLTELEDRMRDLKEQSRLLAPKQQTKLTAERINQLETDFRQATTAWQSGQEQVKALKKQLETLVQTATTATNASLEMRSQLSALQLKELNLLARYPESHPDVKRIRKQLKAVCAQLAEEEKAGPQITTASNKLYLETKLALFQKAPQVAAFGVKAQLLQEQLEKERERFTRMNQNLLKIKRLQRDIDLEEAHYRKYAANLEQARLDQALQTERVSNIRVLGPTCDLRPVRSPKTLYIGLGLLLAVFGTIGLVYVAEYFGQSRKDRLPMSET